MQIDDATLDRARRTGDPVADGVVATVFVDPPVAADPFRHLLAVHGRPDAHDDPVSPQVRDWFDDHGALPAWVDLDRCNRGVDFFAEWSLQIGLGLFLSALPSAYAAESGVPVLALTARLETDAERRIMETAQLVLDVGRHDSMTPGSPAYVTARHVRLMHAGVRHLIRNDPRISPPGPAGPGAFVWEPSWGVPINQEHLAGTLVSFSFTMLEVLDTIGLDYDQQAATDYLHLWSVVGHLLGVEDHLIPRSRHEYAELSAAIKRRNYRASGYGADLTAALLDVVRSYLPRHLDGLAPTTMRSFIGEDVADMLDVPPRNWTRWLLLGIRDSMRSGAGAAGHTAIGRWLTRRVSMAILRGFVETQRPGRPDFAIPRELGIDLPVRNPVSRTVLPG